MYDGGDIWGYFFANPVSFSGHQYHPLLEKFDKKEYLPAFEEIIVLNKSLLPSTTNYRNAIVAMLDDFLPENKRDPYFLKVKEESLKQNEINACSEYNELLETRFNGNVKKYKKAKKKEIKQKKYLIKKYKSDGSMSDSNIEEEIIFAEGMGGALPILELIRKYGFDPSEKCN